MNLKLIKNKEMSSVNFVILGNFTISSAIYLKDLDYIFFYNQFRSSYKQIRLTGFLKIFPIIIYIFITPGYFPDD